MIQARVGQRTRLKGVVCATAAIVCVLIHQAFANHAQQEDCDDIGKNYGENARGTGSADVVRREFTDQIWQVFIHLSLYAEIEIVSRGNGNKNLPYLIGEFANNNIGAASATGIFAVILANIIAIFLLRMVGKNLVD